QHIGGTLALKEEGFQRVQKDRLVIALGVNPLFSPQPLPRRLKQFLSEIEERIGPNSPRPSNSLRIEKHLPSLTPAPSLYQVPSGLQTIRIIESSFDHSGQGRHQF